MIRHCDFLLWKLKQAAVSIWNKFRDGGETKAIVSGKGRKRSSSGILRLARNFIRVTSRTRKSTFVGRPKVDIRRLRRFAALLLRSPTTL